MPFGSVLVLAPQLEGRDQGSLGFLKCGETLDHPPTLSWYNSILANWEAGVTVMATGEETFDNAARHNPANKLAKCYLGLSLLYIPRKIISTFRIGNSLGY